jgi:hypothetical protein
MALQSKQIAVYGSQLTPINPLTAKVAKDFRKVLITNGMNCWILALRALRMLCGLCVKRNSIDYRMLKKYN